MTTRSGFLAGLTLFTILAVSPAARAVQTITITDPTKSPTETWTVGNGSQTVTFTFTEGYSSGKVITGVLQSHDSPSWATT